MCEDGESCLIHRAFPVYCDDVAGSVSTLIGFAESGAAQKREAGVLLIGEQISYSCQYCLEVNIMKIEKLATGVAGAAALAAGSSAYAAIVPVAVPTDLAQTGSTGFYDGGILGNDVDWDVDGDTIADLAFNYRGTPISVGAYEYQANVHTLNGSSVSGYAGYFVTYYGAMVPGGSSVAGAGMVGDGVGGQVAMGSDYASTAYGGWGAVGSTATGYLGFQLSGGNYGWIEVAVNDAGMSFLGAAYEDSGADILAGDVPEPASLSLLALGACALLRRKR